MIKGDTVEIGVPELAQQYGDAVHVVDTVDKHTGGVQLLAIPGVTFDAADLHLTGEAQPRFAPPQKAVEVSPDQIHAVNTLTGTLPAPALQGMEAGFREPSFYRFPHGERCFCGKPYRYTLDGWRCEDNHQKGVQ